MLVKRKLLTIMLAVRFWHQVSDQRIRHFDNPQSAAKTDRSAIKSKINLSGRTVNPPIGGVRQPFLYPSSSTKEKDRLRIDMVGPKTRSNILEIPVEDSSKKEKGYIKEVRSLI